MSFIAEKIGELNKEKEGMIEQSELKGKERILEEIGVKIRDKDERVEESRVKVPSIEKTIGNAATKIASDVDANCIIAIEKKRKEEYEENEFLDVQVVIFKKINQGVYKKIEYDTQVHKVTTGSIIPIKEVLREAINKKYIEKDDRVVCIEDESVGTGFKALIFVFDVYKVFFNISTHKLSEKIDPEVLETILNIALELGREGREGKKIGTAFIIGDKKDIMQFVKQLVINPFAGNEEKSILDPTIRETIKEFSQLDGVFIIDERGTIVSAGAYLDVDTFGIDFKGMGTRHRSCAALTKNTGCIAVVVSESGGLVKVFKNGSIIMKLP